VSPTWSEGPDLAPARPGLAGLARAALRGSALLVALLAGLALLLLLRLAERPLCHPRRPLTPWITVGVCRMGLRLCGLTVERRGAVPIRRGAVLANHSSWLDVLALNADVPVVFVAKSEVAGWPGIGLLARATGTVFVRREARGEARAQVAALRERLDRGECLVLFPEGTTSDGQRVLPFRPALLAALGPGDLAQPVTLTWHAPPGEDPRFYGWWGAAALGPHALAVLAAPSGRLTVTRHAPLAGGDRKALAAEAEARIRAAL
jgi:1-acyl-sn-glycerol-3-phosphate acyltransferase